MWFGEVRVYFGNPYWLIRRRLAPLAACTCIYAASNGGKNFKLAHCNTVHDTLSNTRTHCWRYWASSTHPSTSLAAPTAESPSHQDAQYPCTNHRTVSPVALHAHYYLCHSRLHCAAISYSARQLLRIVWSLQQRQGCERSIHRSCTGRSRRKGWPKCPCFCEHSRTNTRE